MRISLTLGFSPRAAADNFAGSIEPRVLAGQVFADEEADLFDCREVVDRSFRVVLEAAVHAVGADVALPACADQVEVLREASLAGSSDATAVGQVLVILSSEAVEVGVVLDVRVVRGLQLVDERVYVPERERFFLLLIT